MDGLKRSLEEAIKEMQEIPAAAQSVQEHASGPVLKLDTDLHLERAADTLQALHGSSEAVFQSEPIQTLTSNLIPEPQSTVSVEQEFIPAANSIEAALSSAPTVSPHYVPPEPKPVPVVAPLPIVTPVTTAFVGKPIKSTTQNLARKQAGTQFGERQQTRGSSAKPVLKIVSAFSNRRSPAQSGTQKLNMIAPGRLDRAKIAELDAEEARDTKKRRDKIWRWATISLSCAGGLASGWLGSSISGPDGGIFKSSVQTIVGKASDGTRPKPPANIKIVRDGVSKFMSGTVIGSVPGQMTGKTDRAVPLNDDLCTVLELDRGTGLTLAKPCKPIETAEFNSTLGKADLLAQPR